jgi:F420-dependent oxidoreductase-like protein
MSKTLVGDRGDEIMKIAIGLDTDGPLERTLDQARELRGRGFTSMWASQIFGPDTLTVLAIVGRELTDVDLGTAVIPIHPRHPAILAAQARTVQDAIGGHLSLGVGLSHQVIVEGVWGLSFDRPFKYMAEYIAALGPMLQGTKVATQGERVSVTSMGPVGPKVVEAPSLLIAALGPKMLELAGSMTDGTLLWLTGRETIASHIAPRLREAAAAAGRPEPRIVCSLPICVTSDVEKARTRINKVLAVYSTLPSYAAMMAKEGAAEVADVALLGTHDQVLEQLHHLAEAGVTEFSAAPAGSSDEREATLAVLLDYASSD